MSAAKREHNGLYEVSNTLEVYSSSARGAAVSVFRNLADRLESGELDGARVEWRDGLHHIITVEMDSKSVRYRRLEAFSDERPGDYDGDRIVRESIERA